MISSKMNLLKKAYYTAVTRFDLGLLQNKSPIPFIIPYHHLVSDEPLPYIKTLYDFKNSGQFEADLDFLLRHFEPVSLTGLISEAQGERTSGKKKFLVTFDDGLRQAYEIAAPILLRKGIPAALFINPGFVDNREIFYDLKKGLILDKLSGPRPGLPELSRFEAIFGEKIADPLRLREKIRKINYLNKELTDAIGKLLELDFDEFAKIRKPFITTAEIWDLIGKGFQIGAHSMDHPLYALLPEKEQVRQTLESVNWVVTHFRLGYKAFAFPHSDRGVKNSFFEKMTGGPHPELDLILGNSRGMLERHPRVYHRFIGENPKTTIEKPVKAILAYGAIRSMTRRAFVKRD